MTRFAIDARTAIEIARRELVLPEAHSLVAPSLLRSQCLSLLYVAVRRGEIENAEAQTLLERLTSLRIRLLGDRVSRSVAWKIATRLGLDDTADAEYLAVAKLQADALVALDDDLARLADGIVPLAPFGALHTASAT